MDEYFLLFSVPFGGTSLSSFGYVPSSEITKIYSVKNSILNIITIKEMVKVLGETRVQGIRFTNITL
jgi:hypothetical protein